MDKDQHVRRKPNANTGVKFSDERKRNIGKAREVVLTQDQLNLLQELWSKRYVPDPYILARLDISLRVYYRYKATHCTVDQIPFLPRNLSPDQYEHIIEECRAGTPYKNIASDLGVTVRSLRLIVCKLSPFYDIQPLPKPHPPKTEEHKKKLADAISRYNKEHPMPGSSNPNWKGGVTAISNAVRSMERYAVWRRDVLRRDHYKCLRCSSKLDLHVDHIYPFCLILSEESITTTEQALTCLPLWNIDNGRTLCRICHTKTQTWGPRARHYKKETQ